jgi:hypothetical protein
MELEQIDFVCLESSTSFGDIRSHGVSGNRHRVEHAVFCCGEDVFSERVGCEELALRRYNVSLHGMIGWMDGGTDSENFGISIMVCHVEGCEAARYVEGELVEDLGRWC